MTRTAPVALFLLLTTNGCKDEAADSAHHHEAEAFRLAFTAVADGKPVDCTTQISGQGPSGQHTVGLSDLRFYVSNLQLWDADGIEIEATIDANDFQYHGSSDWVGLIDLTGNTEGNCDALAISQAEGTARTNDGISGTAVLDDVASVSFDVGVPQALMQEVIGANTLEGAPSPLNEMYWSWASGYRHIVFNMTVTDGTETGEGYVHIGSRDCGGEGELALENQDSCGFVNTPTVELAGFDLASDTVQVDLGALLQGVDFVAPVTDPVTMEVIGETVGVRCHSMPMQTHCPPAMQNLGIDMTTGSATATANTVFGAN